MKLENSMDLDALLRRWPAPGPASSESEGDDRAADDLVDDPTVAAIVRAALDAGPGDPAELEALFGPPVLAQEPGEPGEAGAIAAFRATEPASDAGLIKLDGGA